MSRISYTACNVISCLIAMNKSKDLSFLVNNEDAEFYQTCLTLSENILFSCAYSHHFLNFPLP